MFSDKPNVLKLSATVSSPTKIYTVFPKAISYFSEDEAFGIIEIISS